MQTLTRPPRHVDASRHHLSFRRPEGRLLGTIESLLFGVLLLGLSALTAGALAAPFAIWAVLPVGLSAPGLVLIAYTGVLFALDSSWIRIDREGVRASGLAGLRPRQVEHLTLSGEVGLPIVISVGDDPLLTELPKVDGWTYPELVWTAKQAASLTGAVLHDRLPHQAWQRYHDDPVFRAQVAVQREVERSSRAWPTFYDRAERRTLATELDGYWCAHLQITRQEVTDGTLTLPLASVDTVTAICWQGLGIDPLLNGATDMFIGCLLIRCGDTVHRLGTRELGPPGAAGVLHAEVELLRQRARLGGGAGDVHDVPAELRRLMST